MLVIQHNIYILKLNPKNDILAMLFPIYKHKTKGNRNQMRFVCKNGKNFSVQPTYQNLTK